MSEFRQDSLTRDWVIVVPERSRRPHDGPAAGPGRSCPFCPGSEGDTPPTVARVDDALGNWKIRVIGNRFPILTAANGIPEPARSDPWHRLPGHGHHEIVIDAPDHDGTLGSLDPEQIRLLLETYVGRARVLGELAAIREVVVFRNHGEQAGASLRHPHSQIVATPVISPVTRRRIMDEIRYYDDHGACAICRTLADEREAGSRFVHESRHFASFAPFASRVSHHLRIVPLRHCARFDYASPEELGDLARHLHTIFAALEEELDNPDHNLVVASPPLDLVHQGANHWFIDVLPRLAVPAGFEIGSGIVVSTCAPETAAAALRTRLSVREEA